MLHEDKKLTSSPSLESSSSSFVQPPSMSSRSIATSIYTSQFDEDEDPWGNFPGTDKLAASQSSLRNGNSREDQGSEMLLGNFFKSSKDARKAQALPHTKHDMVIDLANIPHIYRQIYDRLGTAHGVPLESIERVIASSGIQQMQGQQVDVVYEVMAAHGPCI